MKPTGSVTHAASQSTANSNGASHCRCKSPLASSSLLACVRSCPNHHGGSFVRARTSARTICSRRSWAQLLYVHDRTACRYPRSWPCLQPETRHEFENMREQVLYEQRHEVKSFKEAWTRYRKRVLIAIAVQAMTSLTGTNVIAYCKFEYVLIARLYLTRLQIRLPCTKRLVSRDRPFSFCPPSTVLSASPRIASPYVTSRFSRCLLSYQNLSRFGSLTRLAV